MTSYPVTYEAPPSAFPEASDSVPFPDLAPTQPLSLIIHATNGKHKKDKKKLSTVVAADALEGFFLRLAEVSKGGMSGLKKRDRSKYKKKKAKKAGAAPIEEKK